MNLPKTQVFSGHTLFAECGQILEEVESFAQNSSHLTVDVDLERILNARTKDICYLESVEQNSQIVVHALQYVAPKLNDLCVK